MIRFVCAAVLTSVILGSVALCQLLLLREVDVQFTHDVDDHNSEDHGGDEAQTYDVLVTLGFDAVADPFQLDGTTSGIRLLVRADGQDVISHVSDVRRGDNVVASAVSLAGPEVHFYLEATPGLEESERPCAVRLRVMRGGDAYADTTVWSEGYGAVVQREIRLTLRRQLHELDRGL
ncbi:hypothetical protein ACFL59_10650 [Planctomycetota bacterium]